MPISRKLTAGFAIAAVALSSLIGIAPAANAAVPRPEIAVDAQTGAGQRGFTIRNQGNTTIPANTQFTFHANNAVNIGLFGDPQIQQDWNIGLLGSGYDTNVYLKEPLLPGQNKTFLLSTVEVSALSQWSFELTDPNTAAIDTNYSNNKATIRCVVVVFGLPACSAS